MLADDDESICIVLRQALASKGFAVRVTDNANQLINWVKNGAGDLVITDVMMAGITGIEALREIKQLRPELPVIVISAQSTLSTAIETTKYGADEYFPKPFDIYELTDKVAELLAKSRNDKNITSNVEDNQQETLIGSSPAMQEVFKTIARLVKIDLTVMLEGESGTGKEIIAKSIHDLSDRKNMPFVAINMAAIPKDLVESELFGHDRGAFTGAVSAKKGKFALAEGGTLFLDEIGDMPLIAQTRLLRVLQEGEYSPIGSMNTVKSDVRIICATHHDLLKLCESGGFREDLYYRLNVVPIKIPPLRERKQDIKDLTKFFIKRAVAKGLPKISFDKSAYQVIEDNQWAGNVRELENFTYRVAALSLKKTLSKDDVKPYLASDNKVNNVVYNAGDEDNANNQPFGASFSYTVKNMLDDYLSDYENNELPDGLYQKIIDLVETPLIELSLHRMKGNQIKTADVLGINRNTLRKKIRELDIDYTTSRRRAK